MTAMRCPRSFLAIFVLCIPLRTASPWLRPFTSSPTQARWSWRAKWTCSPRRRWLVCLESPSAAGRLGPSTWASSSSWTMHALFALAGHDVIAEQFIEPAALLAVDLDRGAGHRCPSLSVGHRSRTGMPPRWGQRQYRFWLHRSLWLRCQAPGVRAPSGPLMSWRWRT